MENKLIHENIELKQLNVIQFYINYEITSGNYDKNKYNKNFFLKELKEIKNRYGLNVDLVEEKKDLYHMIYGK